MVILYTDGAAKGNPGRGGYGALLIAGNHKKSISQGFHWTTNNRMELRAVIAGLHILKKTALQVKIYSDSAYVVNAINKGWLNNWRGKKNFAQKKNKDLWEILWPLLQQHQVQFIWIKGHAGHPENEYCDQLACKAAEEGPWIEDHGYL